MVSINDFFSGQTSSFIVFKDLAKAILKSLSHKDRPSSDTKKNAGVNCTLFRIILVSHYSETPFFPIPPFLMQKLSEACLTLKLVQSLEICCIFIRRQNELCAVLVRIISQQLYDICVCVCVEVIDRIDPFDRFHSTWLYS